MQVSIDVTHEMRREAESRGLPIIDYVEMLIQKGRVAMPDDASVSSAIARIRSLRGEHGQSGG